MKTHFLLPWFFIVSVECLNENQSVNECWNKIIKSTTFWEEETSHSNLEKNDLFKKVFEKLQTDTDIYVNNQKEISLIFKNNNFPKNILPKNETLDRSLKDIEKISTKSLKSLWRSIVSKKAPWGYEKVLKSHQKEIEFLKDLFRFLEVDPKLYSNQENGDTAIFINKKELEKFLQKRNYLEKKLITIHKEIAHSKFIKTNADKFLDFWKAKLNFVSSNIKAYQGLFNKEILKSINEELQNIQIILNMKALHIANGNLSLELAQQDTQKMFNAFTVNIFKEIHFENISEEYQKTFFEILKASALLETNKFYDILENLFKDIEKANIENFVAGQVFKSLNYENIENVKFLISKFIDNKIFSKKNTFGVSEHVQILKYIANWQDDSELKNLKISEKIKHKFISLRDLFGILYPKIENASDIINIKTAAQQIATSALANIRNL